MSKNPLFSCEKVRNTPREKLMYPLESMLVGGVAALLARPFMDFKEESTGEENKTVRNLATFAVFAGVSIAVLSPGLDCRDK